MNPRGPSWLAAPFIMRLSLGVAIGVALLVFCGWAYTEWQTTVLNGRYPPEGAFVDIGDGARLHYTERKPIGVERAVVLLLHGASGNQADVMLPLGDRLAAAGFRVLAFDRPGHGWSDRPDGRGDASPARQAVLIRRGLDRLGVHHAIVLGHSWSGALAANFALDQADITQGLVLVSPVLYPWSGRCRLVLRACRVALVRPRFHACSHPADRADFDAGRRGGSLCASTGPARLRRADRRIARASAVGVREQRGRRRQLHAFVTLRARECRSSRSRPPSWRGAATGSCRRRSMPNARRGRSRERRWLFCQDEATRPIGPTPMPSLRQWNQSRPRRNVQLIFLRSPCLSIETISKHERDRLQDA